MQFMRLTRTNLLALAVNIGDRVGWAQADHRAKRYRIQDFALLFTGAHTSGHARVLTFGVDTSET